jgi:hypothetical protein
MDEEFYIEKLIQKAIIENRKDFGGSDEEFEKAINDKLPKVLENLLAGVSEQLYRYCFDKNNDLKKQERKIAKSIKSMYGSGIKIFEAFIELNSKISSFTYGKYYKLFDKLEDHTKLDTLISIHVRACQIANEIRVLVTNGYADGAISRWRTLHELCITFLFLYDNDYETIEMYNDYQAIENWKKVGEYQENYDSFGWESFAKEDLEFFENDKNEMIKKYGKEFGKGYGWTMNVLPNGRRNIREIEKAVGQKHFRPIYTWASENVHSGVSGIKRKLGLRESEQDFLLTSCNDFGFLDSIEFSSSSLTIMSEAFLNMEDSYMNRITKELLYFLRDELINEFSEKEKSDV